MTLPTLVRAAFAAGLTALLLTAAAGCDTGYDPAKAAAQEEALKRTGDGELDAVGLPDGWSVQYQWTGYQDHHLHWTRYLVAPVGGDAAVEAFEARLIDAGWAEGTNCQNSSVSRPCHNYDKGDFHLWPLIASSAKCPPEATGECSQLRLTMGLQ
ncbi:hypothetical protein [Dactylosporangium salmoneum]|uniref:Lipoprotein n=1 Tax=Dactylosporangium salmoneum TaxID=53361 RepID=A0ABN3FEZ4_9ACTN